MTEMDIGSEWYGARLLYESVHPDEPPSPALFEDKVILVRADSEEEAQSRAEALGKKGQHEYLNSDGHRVIWEFRGVLDVVWLFDTELIEGSEVYYHFLKQEEVENIRASLEPGSLGDD